MSLHRPVFRFAPSPNGPLHRGHALSALLNAALAKRFDGQILLRIEDIDIGRTRAEHIASIEEDLKWLGLNWQKPARRQSEHMDDYAKAFRQLKARDLVYPCFCSRRDVSDAIARHKRADSWSIDPDGAPLYPGTCRSLSLDEVEDRIHAGDLPQARLKMDVALAQLGPLAYQTFDPRNGHETAFDGDAAQWGDVVLVRKDTPTSYHLSVVVDDAIQNVTHIVRGKDLEAATSIHVVLQRLLNLPSPVYWHHDVLLDDEGLKLAKSRKSLSLREEIRQGLTRETLLDAFCKVPLWRELLNF